MKIRFLILCSLIYFLNLSCSFGQGKIILLNGKEKRFTTAEVKGEYLEYQPEGTELGTVKKLDRYDVFSLYYDQSGEELIYSPDTVSGEDPTVEEARDYINGEKYAMQVYFKQLNFMGGYVIGVGSSMVLGPFYGLAAPLVYPGIVGQFKPQIDTSISYHYDERTGVFDIKSLPDIQPTYQIPSDAFRAGFVRKARSMKIKNGLLGGGIGFALGITAVIIFFDN